MLEFLQMNGRIKAWLWALLWLLALPLSLSAQAEERLRVGFLCPATEDHPFWGLVVRVMQAAADDLDIELIVKYDITRSTYTTKRLGNFLLNTDPPLDYMLTKYWSAVTEYHLKLAETRGTKVLIFNSGIPADDRKTVGHPRGRYANWIGNMVPDDKKAGMDLTEILIGRAAQLAPDGKVYVLGMISPGGTTVGSDRQNGLELQVKAMSGAVLEHIEEVNWDILPAREATATLLEKYPRTNVIWAANEAITWGAVQSIEQLGRVPGREIFVGGFDWNPDSLKALADGRLSATMVGHFLEGAWALILAHDYHYGFDFADETGLYMTTPLHAVNVANIGRYKDVMRAEYWDEVDFRKYSKKYNPALASYNFNINQFLE
jgi:ABC-type sugar transport system substrate-binding protein